MATFSEVDIDSHLSSSILDQSFSLYGILESTIDPSYSSASLLDAPLMTSPTANYCHQAEEYTYSTSSQYALPVNQGTIPYRPWLPTVMPNYSSEYVFQMTLNPLFCSLQTALQTEYTSECLNPIALIDTVDVTTQHAAPLSVSIDYLHQAFLSANLKCWKVQVSELERFYHVQSDSLETTRHSKLQIATPFNTWICASINTHYDNMHHALINRIHQSLSMLTDTPKSEGLSETLNPTCIKLTTEPTREQTTLHRRQPTPILNQHKESDSSIQTKSLAMTIPAENPRQCKRLFRRKGVLNPVAVRIMSAWYQNNSEHPYPSYETAKVIAEAGDITVDQVKKWFANHRRRTNNTKPMKEIAQRRKVTKRSRSCIDDDDIFFTDSKKARDC